MMCTGTVQVLSLKIATEVILFLSAPEKVGIAATEMLMLSNARQAFEEKAQL